MIHFRINPWEGRFTSLGFVDTDAHPVRVDSTAFHNFELAFKAWLDRLLDTESPDIVTDPFPSLVTAIQHGDARSKTWANDVIQSLDKETAKPLIPQLSSALQDENPAVRRAAETAIRSIAD